MKNKEKYIPAIPDYVAEMIEKSPSPYYTPNRAKRKKFNKWLESYSRKYKYAKLNGYTIDNEPTEYFKKYRMWNKHFHESPVETLEQARNKKTTAGKLYGDLSIKQLKFIIEHTTSEVNKFAARLIIDNY